MGYREVRDSNGNVKAIICGPEIQDHVYRPRGAVWGMKAPAKQGDEAPPPKTSNPDSFRYNRFWIELGNGSDAPTCIPKQERCHRNRTCPWRRPLKPSKDKKPPHNTWCVRPKGIKEPTLSAYQKAAKGDPKAIETLIVWYFDQALEIARRSKFQADFVHFVGKYDLLGDAPGEILVALYEIFGKDGIPENKEKWARALSLAIWLASYRLRRNYVPPSEITLRDLDTEDFGDDFSAEEVSGPEPPPEAVAPIQERYCLRCDGWGPEGRRKSKLTIVGHPFLSVTYPVRVKLPALPIKEGAATRLDPICPHCDGRGSRLNNARYGIAPYPLGFKPAPASPPAPGHPSERPKKGRWDWRRELPKLRKPRPLGVPDGGRENEWRRLVERVLVDVPFSPTPEQVKRIARRTLAETQTWSLKERTIFLWYVCYGWRRKWIATQLGLDVEEVKRIQDRLRNRIIRHCGPRAWEALRKLRGVDKMGRGKRSSTAS